MTNDFGKKVRYYRKKAGKTQLELSQYLGYKSSSSIAKIEDGTNDVLVSDAEKIAHFLGIGMVRFFDPLPVEDESFREYLPYLAQADEKTIDLVRLALGMEPILRLKKSDGASSAEAR